MRTVTILRFLKFVLPLSALLLAATTQLGFSSDPYVDQVLAFTRVEGSTWNTTEDNGDYGSDTLEEPDCLSSCIVNGDPCSCWTTPGWIYEYDPSCYSGSFTCPVGGSLEVAFTDNACVSSPFGPDVYIYEIGKVHEGYTVQAIHNGVLRGTFDVAAYSGTGGVVGEFAEIDFGDIGFFNQIKLIPTDNNPGVNHAPSTSGPDFDAVECVTWGPVVGIDIKPGVYPNVVNSNGHGVIQVAILGSDTLDVSMIDPATLFFSGLIVRAKKKDRFQCSIEDVSGDFSIPEGLPDGYYDLLCKFVDDGSLVVINEAATVEGLLYDGTPIMGADTIKIVNNER